LVFLFLVGCGTLGSIQDAANKVGDIANKTGDVVSEVKESAAEHDWASIIEKIAYGVGAVAGVAGGGMYLNKRRKAKNG